MRPTPRGRAKKPGKLVVLGRVTGPHGIRGEVRVQCLAESPRVFGEMQRLFLLPLPNAPAPAAPEPCAVEDLRPHQGRLLLKLQGVDTRDAAQELRGREIAAPASDLPAPSEREVYLHQLEGLPVLLADGTRLGRVAGFLAGPTEIWRIETPDGREILFPAAQPFVLSIDEDAVTIDPPEGLIDLYLEPKE